MTTPSPYGRLSCIPKSWARWRASSSNSTNEPGSRKALDPLPGGELAALVLCLDRPSDPAWTASSSLCRSWASFPAVVCRSTSGPSAGGRGRGVTGFCSHAHSESRDEFEQVAGQRSDAGSPEGTRCRPGSVDGSPMPMIDGGGWINGGTADGPGISDLCLQTTRQARARSEAVCAR